MNSSGCTCLFVGHREAPESVRPELEAEVERHITEYGVTEFLVGGYGRFDNMAAAVVRGAKKRHPGLHLLLVLAYLPEPECKRDISGYDATIYPEGLEMVPKRFAILRRNEWMVRKSDYLIAYVAHSWGGAAQALKYTHTKERCGGLVITNFAARTS